MGLITGYNLRSMLVRKGTAAMTAGGIAMVVAVFVMTLAIAQGFRSTLVASGSPGNAIVLRKSATAETVSAVQRSDVPIIESLPQVARRADGRALSSPELVTIIALPRVTDNQPANVPVRGVGAQAFEVRETLKFSEGRRFTPGTREINAGKLATGRFKGLTGGRDAMFGAMTTMYAAVAYRTREIGTLRALGFSGFRIVTAFLAESIALAMVGGVIGCILALPVHGLSTGTTNFSSFTEVAFKFRITPALMIGGVIFSAVMGAVGGPLPAICAARIPLAPAAREI